jgi:riboflavin kinase/FMN adenylyltransferase
MKVIYLNDAAAVREESATTIGFFDGVHRGHRYLIERLKEKARAVELPVSVVTFSGHPKKILQNGYAVELLNSFDERISRLASTGIDYCYVIDFTAEFSQMTAEDFIRDILYKRLNIRFLLIGYDHKFGKGRTHSFQHYQAYGKACGMIVEHAEPLRDTTITISSTQIRRALHAGEVKQAVTMLSYNYALDGIVATGNQLGRTIGFPTVNLDITCAEKLIPRDGIYAARAVIDEHVYQGMAYIGNRPTVLPQGEKRIEMHIFNFNREIYGKKIRIELVDFVRPDQSFSGMEELRQQLIRDRSVVMDLFASDPLIDGNHFPAS